MIDTYWFRNNKLNQLAQQQDDIKYTYQFFRNKNGFLDSVIQKSVSINSKSSFPYEKEVFVSNSQGDYTLYCKLRDKDTIDLEQNSYIYDQKGNWIRRLSYNKEVAIMPIKRRFSGYSLSIREISY